MTEIEARLATSLGTRYGIERELGRGGMATVYLARDLKHQRLVALKVLDPELGAVLGAERFLSEIRVTANLQHPNLLPLFDSGEASGLLFYVMPYVDGETLRQRIDREKQLPIDEAVRITVAVANALAYAHERGVIHRDLKPENILMQAGQPVIADFGIALAISNAGGTRVTQTGLSLGTPQYMSPEQATGDRFVDGRADLYSLGAVAYEMITGEPPHVGTTAQAIIAKLMTEEVRPLTVLRRTVPTHVDAAVRRVLEKLPADRFATASEFAAALTNPALTALPPAATGGGVKRSASWKWIALASATVAGIALAAAWSMRESSMPRPVLRYIMAFDSTEQMSGIGTRLALSPDGSKLVYPGGPTQQLILRRRNTLQGEPIPGTQGARSPFFSPDGNRVAFITGTRALKIVPLDGSPPVVVTDSVIGLAGGAWSKDGYIYEDGVGSTALVRVEARQNAIPKYFTTLDTTAGESNHAWPDVLPNGKGILFQIRYSGGAQNAGTAIGIADAKTGKHRVLMPGVYARYSPSGHVICLTADGSMQVVPFDQDAMKLTGEPIAVSAGVKSGATPRVRFGESRGGDVAVSASGTLMYITGGGEPNRDLVWVGRDGAARPVDSTWHDYVGEVALSPDGRHAAVVIAAARADVWIKQLDNGPLSRLSVEGVINTEPFWSTDGKSVLFVSDASGTAASSQHLFIKRADGSTQAKQIPVPGKQSVAEAIVTPTGGWIIYRTPLGDAKNGDIYAFRPGVDTVPLAIVATRAREAHPAISPDGKFLAYVSDESGRGEVFVVPFPDVHAAKWPVSTHGADDPQWSPKGDELFYRDDEGNLIAVVVKTSPTFAAGKPVTLFNHPTWRDITRDRRAYAVSPDGRRFLTARAASARGNLEQLVVIENWFEELKAKRDR